MCAWISGHVESLDGERFDDIPATGLDGDDGQYCACWLDKDGPEGDGIRQSLWEQVVKPLAVGLAASGRVGRIVIEFI